MQYSSSRSGLEEVDHAKYEFFCNESSYRDAISRARRDGALHMIHLTGAAVMAVALLALTACYHGPNLRDCSDWSTRSIAGCYRG